MTASSDDVVILMGGPMHRRVYYRGDVPTRAPYRDSGRFATKTLGEIYSWLGKEVDNRAGLSLTVPRVWEWTGTVEPSLTARATPPGGFGFARSCTYRGCLSPAVWSIAGNMERRPWLACEEHKAGMVKALSIGRTADYSVDPTPI